MKLHEQYYVEKAKVEKLIAKKNQKSDFYNGIYDRYTDPVLTREHIPVEWKYDVNPRDKSIFYGASWRECRDLTLVRLS